VSPSIRTATLELLEPLRPEMFLREPASAYPLRAGRMLRPALLIATACAFGGRADQALTSAVAIELLHNAFLIHDDIEDESELRRGAPTLQARYGVPLAVNAGDALLAVALQALIDGERELGPALTRRVLAETSRTVRTALEGQATELGWQLSNELPADDAAYFTMVLQKTCSYTTVYPLRVGALIGSRGTLSEARLDDVERLGFLLGAAFQIQDDLLNLDGDAQDYGKELSGDLWEGKRTLMLIHLGRVASERERNDVLAVLAMPRVERRLEDVAWLLERVRAYGSDDYARAVAHGLAGAARHEFERTLGGLPQSTEKRFIEELATWVLTRAR